MHLKKFRLLSVLMMVAISNTKLPPMTPLFLNCAGWLSIPIPIMNLKTLMNTSKLFSFTASSRLYLEVLFGLLVVRTDLGYCSSSIDDLYEWLPDRTFKFLPFLFE